MRLTIPITGTVAQEGKFSKSAKVNEKDQLIGDPLDSIRPIGIDLGPVSWSVISVDIEKEQMTIEVTPSDKISVPTGKIDEEGEPIYIYRQATSEEKAEALEIARQIGEEFTKDELFAITGDKRLERPFKQIY